MFYEEKEGEKVIGTQDFEAECVLLPSQKYLNIPKDGYEPYPQDGNK